MSVVFQTILLYGYEIPFDSIDVEVTFEYEPDETAPGETIVVSDGRGGEYEYVGTLIAKTNTTRDGPQSFDGPVELEEDDVVTGKTIEILDDAGVEVEEPSYHLLTHVT